LFDAERSLKNLLNAHGKAEPFRTEAGEAGNP